MRHIIARSHFGAIDLYYGVPNMQDAVVIRVETAKDVNGDRGTTMTLQLKDGGTCQITIKQER